MNTSKNHYLDRLENTVKAGLALYLLVFFIGTIVAITGTQTIINYFKQSRFEVSIMSGIMVFSLFFGLYYLAGKVRWLNELHVRLDHRFFGFLNKSNDAIFSTLITALPPNEQSHYRSFPNEKKHKTTQSIFSNLSIDNELYTALFQSGIFKMWIRYWVTIYGTFAFILLTTGSFTSLIVRLDSSVRDVFTLSWILALLHILLSVVIGRYLVKRTQATVQQIVDTHCLEIAGLLRVNIVDIPVVIEDEDVAHIDDEF